MNKPVGKMIGFLPQDRFDVVLSQKNENFSLHSSFCFHLTDFIVHYDDVDFEIDWLISLTDDAV